MTRFGVHTDFALFYKIALGSLLVVVSILASALYISNRRLKEQSLIVETPILRESGVRLEPSETKYDVIVWNHTKLSTGAFDMREIFQIRIEAKSSSHEYVFEWPNPDSCSPGAAELRDVGGKGWMAFLIYCNLDIRVVRFDGTRFLFRPSVDQIHPVLGPSAFSDLNNDGVIEYVAVFNYPQKFGDPRSDKTLPVPAIYRWCPEDGFQEVSGLFPESYRKKVTPELRKQQREEADSLRRHLYENAIEYVEQQLSSKTPPMAPVS